MLFQVPLALLCVGTKPLGTCNTLEGPMTWGVAPSPCSLPPSSNQVFLINPSHILT